MASFARAATRPFAATTTTTASVSSVFFNAHQPTTATLVRRLATARPAPRVTFAAASPSKPTPRAGFASASFLAASFRRAAHRANKGGSSGRRYQSSGAGAGAGANAGPHPSWFQRMWDSPIGLKTVHFWAPVMKWALVLAGVSDFARPAEKLSVTQNLALTATGLIWTRWCLIIKPKNYLLAAVNFFLGIVGVIQCTRIFMARGRAASDAAVPVPVTAAKEEAKP